MKTMLFFFIIILSASNIYSQVKDIETGLYLVLPHDSCTGKNNKHTIEFLSDTLCIAPEPVISVKDIESCMTDSLKLEGKKQYSLNIKLKESASLRFKEITTENVGKKLVFIIDNKVVMAPVIRDPITSGRLSIYDEYPVIKELRMKLKQEMHQ